jgi:hypothetical protein
LSFAAADTPDGGAANVPIEAPDGAPSDAASSDINAGGCPGAAACTREIFVTSKTYLVGPAGIIAGSAGFNSIDTESPRCNEALAETMLTCSGQVHLYCVEK